MEKDDDDPLQYINTGYDDGGLMAEEYDSGYECGDELMHDLPELEHPKSDCRKSL
jgi:hypothetical protein